jgi:hypothetical protein
MPGKSNPLPFDQRKVLRGVSPADRFWHYVNKTDGCWEWRGRPPVARNYPIFSFDTPAGRKHMSVPRFAYQLTRGSIPEGLNVLHHCDNRLCVRPDHLYAGTQAQNVRDMVARGRHPRSQKVQQM